MTEPAPRGKTDPKLVKRRLSRLNLHQEMHDAVARESRSDATDDFDLRLVAWAYFDNRHVQLFMVLASFASCVVYVVESYALDEGGDLPSWSVILELVFSGIFIIDYVMSVAIADERMHYVLSTNSATDLLTIIPAIAIMVPEPDLGFLRVLRVAKAVRLLRLHRIVDITKGRGGGAVLLTAINLGLTTLGVVFVFTGLVHALQNLDSNAWSNATGKPLQFHDAFYFVVVTVSTVGYGDIGPLTTATRIVMVFFILLTFTLIPYKVTALVEAFASQSSYTSSYRPSSRLKHVVCIGSFNDDVEPLSAFLHELFHADHGRASRQLKCCVLCAEEPSDDVKLVVHSLRFRRKVTYIKGDPMDADDLERAKLGEAHAVFVLSAPMTALSQSAMTLGSDADTVLTVLSARQFNPEVRVFPQISMPGSKVHLNNAGVPHVVCREELKMALLAQSALCPGFITMVNNLVQSSTAEHVEALQSSGEELSGWFPEYARGAQLECYFVSLAPFEGMTFLETALTVYRHSGVLLLGVANTGSEVTESPYLINPGSTFTCSKASRGVIIANNAEDVAEIEAWTPGTKRIQQWWSKASMGPGAIQRQMSAAAVREEVIELVEANKASRGSSSVADGSPLSRALDAAETGRKAPAPLSLDAAGDGKEEEVEEEEKQVPETPRGVIGAIHELAHSDESLSSRTIDANLSPAAARQGLRRESSILAEAEAATQAEQLAARGGGDEDAEGGGGAGELLDHKTATIVENAVVRLQTMLAGGGREPDELRDAMHALSECLNSVEGDEFDPPEHLSQHVVLSGPLHALGLFLRPFRTLHRHTAVLVLHPSRDEFLAAVSGLRPKVRRNIYHVRGIMSRPADLERCHVRRAQAVLLMPLRLEEARERPDTNVLLATVELQALLGPHSSIYTLCELSDEENMKFLGMLNDGPGKSMKSDLQRDENDDILRSPAMAAGHCYTDVTTPLVAQLYYNDQLLLFWLCFVRGGDRWMEAVEHHGGSDTVESSSLRQIPLPQEFVGKEYGELVLFLMLKHDSVPLGLYRARGTNLSPGPYVCTNPRVKTKLEARDRVFVLTYQPYFCL